MFLSAVWTLILTAPIHCRASIAETLMQRHISPNLMKKQTPLCLGWAKNEYIFIFRGNYSFKTLRLCELIIANYKSNNSIIINQNKINQSQIK